MQAILAFDYANDEMIDRKHLANVKNRYNPADSMPAEVSAIIVIDQAEFSNIIKAQKDNLSDTYEEFIKNPPIELTITRCLNGKASYKIEDNIFKDVTPEIQNKIAEEITKHLPYIIYFDDFSDSIPSIIEIKDGGQDSWQQTMDCLLKSVNSDYSTVNLASKDENDILSIQSDVSVKLTKTIADKWNQWKDIVAGEKVDRLSIQFIYSKNPGNIKLKVMERINDNESRSFDITERSKGFIWFFNYVIKSEFNPKKADLSESKGVIFLLDEPGSYLHVSMQERLCVKLAELSKTSIVIYCTHSHNLLKPEYIENANIRVCHKETSGNILMQKISDYATNTKVSKDRKALAFEPIYHVLGVSDILINGTKRNVLLTEGINDFYTFQMFKNDEIDLSFLPSTNANHIQYNIPTFLACERKFMCLYDYDKENGEGNKEWKKLKNLFGEEIEQIAFRTTDIDGLIVEPESLYDKDECVNVQQVFFKYTGINSLKPRS